MRRLILLAVGVAVWLAAPTVEGLYGTPALVPWPIGALLVAGAAAGWAASEQRSTP